MIFISFHDGFFCTYIPFVSFDHHLFLCLILFVEGSCLTSKWLTDVAQLWHSLLMILGRPQQYGWWFVRSWLLARFLWVILHHTHMAFHPLNPIVITFMHWKGSSLVPILQYFGLETIYGFTLIIYASRFSWICTINWFNNISS